MKSSTKNFELKEAFLELPDAEGFESKPHLTEPNEMFKLNEKYLPILNADPRVERFRKKPADLEPFKLYL